MGLRILHVEDAPAPRRVVQRYVEAAGHRVVACETLEEARELIASESWDVILVDVHLPGGNGLGFVTEARENQPSARILVVSGDTDADVARAAIEAGAEAYLLKPINPKELLILLR